MTEQPTVIFQPSGRRGQVPRGTTVRAADLLLGRDDYAMRYIKYFRAAEALREKESQPAA